MTWATVRNFGRVKYFNVSYVVLFLVPLLADVPFKVPISETMKFVFAASLAYALAIAIYQYWCPSIIKTYENEETYAAALHPIYERAYLDKKFEIVISNLADTQEDIKQDLTRLNEQMSATTGTDQEKYQELLDAQVNLVYPGCVQAFLLNSYRNALNARPVARIVAAALYIVGTCIVLVLLAAKAYVVLFPIFGAS